MSIGKFSWLLVFRLLRYCSSTGRRSHGNSMKIEITSITPALQIFFQISLAFNMFSTLVLVEVKLSGN